MQNEEKHQPTDQNLHQAVPVQATAWFSVLLHARSKSKFKEAAEAQHKLEELGVIVRFRRGGGK